MDENYSKALNIAYKLIAIRMRSVFEIKRKLLQKDIDLKIVQKVLEQLIDEQLLDDENFAKEFVLLSRKNRSYGIFRLKHELQKRGISASIISDVLGNIDVSDEEELAFEVARRRYLGADALDKEQVSKEKKRIFSFLQRKGFSQDICRKVVFSL